MAAAYPAPYTPSTLVQDFHQFPHYDFSFKPVSSDFDPTNTDYLEALGQLALPLSFAAVLFTLYFLARLCCCAEEVDPFKPTGVKCARGALIASMVLAVVSVAFTFVGGVKASHAVTGFMDKATSTVGLINGLISDVNDDRSYCQYLANNVTSITVTDPTDQKVKNGLIQGLQQCNTTLSSVSDFSGKLNLDQWNDKVDQAGKMLSITCLVTSALLAALVLSTLIATGCRSYNLLRCSRVFLILAFLCCWGATSVELGVSVGVADFCTNPNGFVMSKLGSGQTDIAYYIECSGKYQYPFSTQFQSVESLLGDALNASTYLATKYPSFNPISSSIKSLNTSFINVNASLDCRAGLHDGYQGLVDYACNDSLSAVVMLCFAHGVTGLMFLIALFSAIRLLPSLSPRLGYTVNDNFSSERSPLLKSSAMV